jgi:hypothetical protein
MNEYRRARLAVGLARAVLAASAAVAALGFAAGAALGTPPASSKVRGAWTDPVGACTGHIVSSDPATGALVCTGTSRWTGTWRGSTKWTLTGKQC